MKPTQWVWVDFENTPHVLFLEPLIRRLADLGWVVRVTAKPQAQTLGLAAQRGIEAQAVGGGDFGGIVRKVFGAVGRAMALAKWIGRHGRPRLLISCSRSASLAAWWLRVPGVALLDYEHAEQRVLALASRAIWFPDLLSEVRLPRATRRVARYYEGLKENLYLDRWTLDRATERKALRIVDNQVLVVARPPAESAHYAKEGSTGLWNACVRALQARGNTRVLVVPRTPGQRARLVQEFSPEPGVRVVEDVVAGPALVAAADLVIGGGGTMNREAAVLGVPVWSLFSGPTPRIDECLATEGRLRWVRNQRELDAALNTPVKGPGRRRGPFPRGLEAIVEDLEQRLAASRRVAA